MKHVNLLPTDLARSRERSRTRRHLGLAAGALLIALASWAGLAYSQVRGLNTRIHAAELELARRESNHTSDGTLASESARLQEYLESVEALKNQLPPASALALLTHLAPDAVRFDELVVSRVATGEGPRPKAAAGATPDRRAKVRLEGNADTDAAVVSFMARLSENPFLQNLRAQQSRRSDHEGESTRRFSVTMEIVAASPSTAEVNAE